MQTLDHEDIEALKIDISMLMQQSLAGKNIITASQYFAVWRELRKIVDEELTRIVNDNCAAELAKINSA